MISGCYWARGKAYCQAHISYNLGLRERLFCHVSRVAEPHDDEAWRGFVGLLSHASRECFPYLSLRRSKQLYIYNVFYLLIDSYLPIGSPTVQIQETKFRSKNLYRP